MLYFIMRLGFWVRSDMRSLMVGESKPRYLLSPVALFHYPSPRVEPVSIILLSRKAGHIDL